MTTGHQGEFILIVKLSCQRGKEIYRFLQEEFVCQQLDFLTLESYFVKKGS